MSSIGSHYYQNHISMTYHQPDRVKAYLGELLRSLLLFPALRGFTPLRVEGRERLGAGPYIFAANHSSHLDAPALLAALPRHLRVKLRVAAAADYFFKSQWRGRLVSLFLNAFAFERQRGGCRASMLYATQLLNSGQSLLIFPEGTRTPDGEIHLFRQGVGKLTLASGVPIIPVWIEGTYAAWPKGASLPRHQPIAIHFGPPIEPGPLENDPIQISNRVEEAVKALATQQTAQSNKTEEQIATGGNKHANSQ